MQVGIDSTEAMAGSAAIFAGLQAQMMAALAANSGTAALVLPPGNEGASARALVNQNANAVTFATNMGLGFKEMGELSAVVESANITTEITAVGAAARL